MQTIKTYKGCFKDRLDDVLLSRTLSSPDGKIGDEMVMSVRLASLVTGIHEREFTFNEMAALCPLIRSIPDVLLDIMEIKPVLTTEGNVVSLMYKFAITTSKSASTPALNTYYANLLLAMGPGAGIPVPDAAARTEAVATLNSIMKDISGAPEVDELYYEDRVGKRPRIADA